jgi:hypothetical protein
MERTIELVYLYNFIACSQGTFGKHFRHILDIGVCYVESIINKSLTFFRLYIDPTLESDKERLIQELDAEDGRLEKILASIGGQKATEKYIDCSKVMKYLCDAHPQASPVQVLSWLTEHEILHEGELALYVRAVKMKFPDSQDFGS